MDDFTQKNSDGLEQESSLSDDAVPVCPNCLEPCDPLDNYCPHCGSNEAVNPLASYMPFVDLRFRIGMIGKLWRKTWSTKTAIGQKIIYICLFLLYMPILFLVLLVCTLYEKFIGHKPYPYS
jgi:hypothetical protein